LEIELSDANIEDRFSRISREQIQFGERVMRFLAAGAAVLLLAPAGAGIDANPVGQSVNASAAPKRSADERLFKIKI
jgi:hypothetical protein